MVAHQTSCSRLARLSAAAALTLSASSPVIAQTPYWTTCPPPPPCATAPGVTTPAWPPSTAPSTMPPTAPSDAVAPPSVAPESSALALSGSSVAMAAPGYVDFAVPITQFRLRFDAAYGNNRPDRAEFFYSKCGCFATLPGNNPQFDPKAAGPPKLETNVDYQELRPYVEVAFSNRFSVFVDAPVRFINPDQNDNATGFGNLLAGFKYAMVANPDQYVTLQFVTWTPTADADRGLGNDLWALEPGLLWYRQLTDRMAFQSEVRDWIPLGGTDFAGNVLRYGSALSYTLHNGCKFRVTPITEVVGWTVLSGKELAVANPGSPNGVNAVATVQDASGDTIINGKIGVRFGFGEPVGVANLSRSDLYIGYGRAFTGEVWYKDVFRVEYALRF